MTDKNGKLDLIGNGHAVSMITPTLDEASAKLAKEQYNKAIEKEKNQYNAHIERTLEKSKEIVEKAGTMEIMPLSGNVLLRPYSENPFKIMKETDSGLILPGNDGLFQNPDSGEGDKMEMGVVWADVIEVSPEAKKFLREGDIVLFRNRSQSPVPFLNQGFCVTHINNILTVVNEGLVERYKNL